MGFALFLVLIMLTCYVGLGYVIDVICCELLLEYRNVYADSITLRFKLNYKGNSLFSELLFALTY